MSDFAASTEQSIADAFRISNLGQISPSGRAGGSEEKEPDQNQNKQGRGGDRPDRRRRNKNLLSGKGRTQPGSVIDELTPSTTRAIKPAQGVGRALGTAGATTLLAQESTELATKQAMKSAALKGASHGAMEGAAKVGFKSFAKKVPGVGVAWAAVDTGIAGYDYFSEKDPSKRAIKGEVFGLRGAQLGATVALNGGYAASATGAGAVGGVPLAVASAGADVAAEVKVAQLQGRLSTMSSSQQSPTRMAAQAAQDSDMPAPDPGLAHGPSQTPQHAPAQKKGLVRS